MALTLVMFTDTCKGGDEVINCLLFRLKIFGDEGELTAKKNHSTARN